MVAPLCSAGASGCSADEYAGGVRSRQFLWTVHSRRCVLSPPCTWRAIPFSHCGLPLLGLPGTFANMYGYLLGMRKTGIEDPESGLKSDTDYRFIHSAAGHYSNHTALATLGVNSNSRAICCRIDKSNSLDVKHLEHTLEMCFRLNIVVPTIMLTMGTTDTFGVDPLRKVREVVDRLSEKYSITNPPHIHVDTAVGWPMIFFNGKQRA